MILSFLKFIKIRENDKWLHKVFQGLGSDRPERFVYVQEASWLRDGSRWRVLFLTHNLFCVFHRRADLGVALPASVP